VKLLDKYSRVHIITACIVLLISSVAYYFIIRSVLLKQIDNDLKVEEQEIVDFIEANNSLPHASDYKYQQIRFEVLKEGTSPRQIVNTAEYIGKDKEYEPFRMLAFPVRVNGISYKAIVYKSRGETEDLLRLIMTITATIFVVFFSLMFIVNRLVLGKLWQPFFNTLSELKKFDLHAKQHLSLSSSTIEEFEELNSVVSQMTGKVSREYEVLKSFTDDASHEMQTPLAIIRSKLDLLIQSSNESQAEQLQAIYDATGRLARLHQALSLLTKIENQQFSNPEKIDLKALLEDKFQQFDELIKAKNIRLTYELEWVCILMNKELADILLNNLLINAIKHNYEGGTIECVLHANKLSVSNSGPELTFDKVNIFNRFQKSHHSSGTGLGLAVVKQICDASGLSIGYFHLHDKHIFHITFTSA
jgi:signal transduction histidine kinase